MCTFYRFCLLAYLRRWTDYAMAWRWEMAYLQDLTYLHCSDMVGGTKPSGVVYGLASCATFFSFWSTDVLFSAMCNHLPHSKIQITPAPWSLLPDKIFPLSSQSTGPWILPSLFRHAKTSCKILLYLTCYVIQRAPQACNPALCCKQIKSVSDSVSACSWIASSLVLRANSWWRSLMAKN